MVNVISVVEFQKKVDIKARLDMILEMKRFKIIIVFNKKKCYPKLIHNMK